MLSLYIQWMTLLRDISCQPYKWEVIMWLARIWEFRNQDTGVLYELDFVLVDRQVNGTLSYHFHAIITFSQYLLSIDAYEGPQWRVWCKHPELIRFSFIQQLEDGPVVPWFKHCLPFLFTFWNKTRLTIHSWHELK